MTRLGSLGNRRTAAQAAPVTACCLALSGSPPPPRVVGNRVIRRTNVNHTLPSTNVHLGKPFIEDQCPLLIPTTVLPPLTIHRRNTVYQPRLAAIPEEPPVDLLSDKVVYPLPSPRVSASHSLLASAVSPARQPAVAPPASGLTLASVVQSPTTLVIPFLPSRGDLSPAVSHRASTARSTLRASAPVYSPGGRVRPRLLRLRFYLL